MKKLLDKYPNLTIYIGLFLSLVVLYWPVSFFTGMMKWDMIDYFLPYRHFFSESLHNGNLPLWNPYHRLGFPFFADLQSGFWYPVTWIFSLFGTYSIYTITIEFLFHIYIGSIGFYKLMRYLNLSISKAFIVALVFLANGVFVSNAQHLSWIIGIAYIPWIYFYFKKFLDAPEIRSGFALSLLVFLQITGGYPIFFVITFYVLLVYFFYWIYSKIKNNEKKRCIVF